MRGKLVIILHIMCIVFEAVVARNHSVQSGFVLTKEPHSQHPIDGLVAITSACTGSELYLHLMGVVQGPLYNLRLEVSLTHGSPAVALREAFSVNVTFSDNHVVRLLLPAGATEDLRLWVSLYDTFPGLNDDEAFLALSNFKVACVDKAGGHDNGVPNCLDSGELTFLQRLSMNERLELASLVGMRPETCSDASRTFTLTLNAASASEWDAIDCVVRYRCVPNITLLREALAELGLSTSRNSSTHTNAALRTASHLAHRAHFHHLPPPTRPNWTERLVSANSRRCTPREFMNAVRNGYRSDADGVFLVEGCRVKWYQVFRRVTSWSWYIYIYIFIYLFMY